MTLSPAAEALFDALQHRVSGTLELVADQGRRASISLFEGDVVDARVGFAFQSMGQVLWQEGQLTAPQLDALWSSGEAGELHPTSLVRLGLEPQTAEALRWRAQVREMVAQARGFQFVAAPVAESQVRLPGAQAVRAACEASAPPVHGRWFRVLDLNGCLPWVTSPEEARWLEERQGYFPGTEVPATYVGLLLVLERSGVMEARDQAPEPERLSRPIEREPEVGWDEALQELSAPPPGVDLYRSMTPSAGLPRADELVDESWSDLLENAPTQEPRALEERAAVQARQRAQADLVREMNEALRRAGAAPADEWLVESSVEPLPPEPRTPAMLTYLDSSERLAESVEMRESSSPPSVPPIYPPPAVTREVPMVIPSAAIASFEIPFTMPRADELLPPATHMEPLEFDDEFLDEGLTESASPPASLAEPLPEPEGDVSPEVTWEPEPAAEPARVRLDSAVPVLQPAPGGPPMVPNDMPAPWSESENTPVADLWSILKTGMGPTWSDPTASSSFEQALESVDAHLEEIASAPVDDAELPELTIETTFEGDNPFGTDQTSSAEPSDVSGLSEENWADFGLDGEDELAGDPSDPAEAARLRRQRLMRRAMENLGAFQGRPPSSSSNPAVSEPPASVAPTVSAPASHPVPAAPASVSPAPASASTADETQLAALIEKRHAEVKAGIDFFAVLGLPHTVGKDEVKGAFLNLAKIFHPDRLPASLVGLAPKMTSVFEAVRESYELLYDDARRKGYLQELELKARAEAASPTTPGQSAEESYKKAEALFRKRDFIGAEQLYAHAHELKPSASYLAARAWAIYMDPTRKSELTAARQMMNDALKLDRHCDRAQYQLGVIARVEGDMERAERHFRDAVSANPKHLEAAQELRLVEMRKRKNTR